MNAFLNEVSYNSFYTHMSTNRLKLHNNVSLEPLKKRERKKETKEYYTIFNKSKDDI